LSVSTGTVEAAARNNIRRAEAHGVILLFSEAEIQSFQLLKTWIDVIFKFFGDHIPKLLVGIKADREPQTVPSITAKDFAAAFNIPFFELDSPDDKVAVKAIFLSVVKKLLGSSVSLDCILYNFLTDGYLKKGQLLVESWRYDDVFKCWNKAASLKLTTPDSGLNASLAAKVEEQVFATYDRFILDHPGYLQAHLYKGIALFSFGKYEESINSYNFALQMMSDRMKQKSIPNDEFISLQKACGLVHYHKGHSLKALNNLRDAVNSYQLAIELRDNFETAYFDKASSLNLLGDNDAALEVYNQILKFNPQSVEAFDQKGLLLISMGKLEDAMSVYAKGMTSMPRSYIMWRRKAKALMSAKEFQSAIEEFELLRISYPDENGDEYFSIGCALSSLGKHEEAIDYFKKSVGYQVDPSESYNQMAISAEILGLDREAIEFNRRATRFRPSLVTALRANGALLRKLGMFGEAAEVFETLNRRESSLENEALALRCYFEEAKVYYDMGMFEESLKLLNLNLQRSPTHLLSLDLKVKCYAQMNRFKSIWPTGALLKAHFTPDVLRTQDLSTAEQNMLAKSIKRFLWLGKWRNQRDEERMSLNDSTSVWW
jgi:tetratricopeptide (TPR) repeat protein